MAISFIVPDAELNTRLLRVLMIFSNLSLNRMNNAVLNVDKITVYDFLLQHPYILQKITKGKGKANGLVLLPEENNCISAEYPDGRGVFRTDEMKKLIQVLIIYGFIDVRLNEDNDLRYDITGKGKEFLLRLEVPYKCRLTEMCKAMVSLQSLAANKVIEHIKPYMNGRY